MRPPDLYEVVCQLSPTEMWYHLRFVPMQEAAAAQKRAAAEKLYAVHECTNQCARVGFYSRGGRGPTGATGRGPKRAAEANGQVRRHVDAAARPVVGAEPVLCANRRPLAERSSTTGSSFERILPDCGTRTVGHGRAGVVRMWCAACGRTRGLVGLASCTSGRERQQTAAGSEQVVASCRGRPRSGSGTMGPLTRGGGSISA